MPFSVIDIIYRYRIGKYEIYILYRTEVPAQEKPSRSYTYRILGIHLIEVGGRQSVHSSYVIPVIFAAEQRAGGRIALVVDDSAVNVPARRYRDVVAVSFEYLIRSHGNGCRVIMSRFITRALRRIVYFQVVGYNAYVRVCIRRIQRICRRKTLSGIRACRHERH